MLNHFPIKLEQVDDVILNVRTIQTNIHKIIQDDFDDEDITASSIVSYEFDLTNNIKQEPSEDFIFEIKEFTEVSIKTKGLKRGHPVIVDQLPDISKKKKICKRSNSKALTNKDSTGSDNNVQLFKKEVKDDSCEDVKNESKDFKCRKSQRQSEIRDMDSIGSKNKGTICGNSFLESKELEGFGGIRSKELIRPDARYFKGPKSLDSKEPRRPDARHFKQLKCLDSSKDPQSSKNKLSSTKITNYFEPIKESKNKFSSLPSTNQPSPITSTNKFECKQCFQQFGTRLGLYCHTKTHLPRIPCKICGRHVKAYLMTKHMRYHNDIKAFQCDLCPKKFINIASIRSHMYQHMSIKRLSCNICGRGYNDSRHLREHKLGHTNPNAYRCDLCPKGYERKQALEVHMLGNHMQDSRCYTCKVCGYTTKMMSVLYSHMKRHYKHIKCEDCGYMFSNNSELRDHVLAVHVRVKDVPCTLCGKFFYSKRYMMKHIRRTHADPSKFKCDFCEYTFKCIDGLKQHLRRHNDRIRECDICMRKVKESNMKKHQSLNALCKKLKLNGEKIKKEDVL